MVGPNHDLRDAHGQQEEEVAGHKREAEQPPHGLADAPRCLDSLGVLSDTRPRLGRKHVLFGEGLERSSVRAGRVRGVDSGVPREQARQLGIVYVDRGLP